ncbi:hypothetical protein LV164_001696 [Aspergillus fumigatus]|nr:hypothetical protein CNMCM8812_002707 [Aspergillus fumigatus]KMK61577.1 endoglucanase [Aspergillus fumigatus Z5]KAH1489095.1 hypothetical protein KXX42_001503 [Aspergillus fumigatus]KAH1513944.1 hypothetical protein KXX29_001460 [Aspergillus fumigatus]KAH1548947.1 hypothetical protein KXX57_001225 [Aspergillus fumigatus]
MKLSLLASVALVPFVSAHYFFDVLVIDGKETRSNEFVRSNTRPAKYNPTKWKNIRDDMTPDMLDFRCNKGAFTFAGQTGTAEVKAGSKLAMKLAVGATMQHPGPALVYMSKAPSSAKTYEGDGDWFKIHEEGVCNKNADFTKDAWCTWDKDRIEFTIPADLPDGEYLIRPEHIGLHGAHDGQAEFYYTCAQVKVVGGGTGTPGPTIKFPGGYKKDDPSFNFSLWNGYKDYPMPGPTVWTGGSGSGSSSYSKVANVTSSDESSQSGASSSQGTVSTCPNKYNRRHARQFKP